MLLTMGAVPRRTLGETSLSKREWNALGGAFSTRGAGRRTKRPLGCSGDDGRDLVVAGGACSAAGSAATLG